MKTQHISCLWIWMVCGCCLAARAQQTQPLQHAWEIHPDLGDIWSQTRPSRTSFIDVEELASSQIQQRLNVAQLICLNHDREGFQHGNRALELLLARLTGNAEPILVRRVMMSAACLLDDGTNAKTLWDCAQSDREMRVIVERSLMKWNSPVALDWWRQTLRNEHASPSDVALALEGISITGSAEDQELLIDVLRSNSTTPSNRFLAAQALGATNASGLAGFADEVMKSDVVDRHTLAANLLRNHSDEGALNQLVDILSSGSETSKWIAATVIAKHFPQRATTLAPEWTTHDDGRIRLLSLQALQREPSQDTLRLQATLLADPLASVRNAARENLMFQAGNGFKTEVDECISKELQAEAWEGLEQTIILVAQLQDRTRCNAIFDLLQHPRPEVHVHAGWALMELADEPEMLNQIQAHCEVLTEQLESGTVQLKKADLICLSYLLEALGRNRFAPALTMLMKYVPKNDFRMGNLSRASAIWAIGQIRADQHDAELRARLCERLKDLPPANPENYLVRFACLLVLGQFAHPDAAETIQAFGSRPPNALGQAAQWALQQIEKANP